MTSISELTTNWEGAVVTLIDRNGLKMERAAVFVFDWPKGFAWLEPGYADPWGSPSPTWYELEVTVDRVKLDDLLFRGSCLAWGCRRILWATVSGSSHDLVCELAGRARS